MTMQENDTQGVWFVRGRGEHREPCWRTALLCLITVATASIVLNAILLGALMKGGAAQ